MITSIVKILTIYVVLSGFTSLGLEKIPSILLAVGHGLPAFMILGVLPFYLALLDHAAKWSLILSLQLIFQALRTEQQFSDI